MFVYEIKNILVNGKPVNGLIFQSTVGTDDLIPAEDGAKLALIYVDKEDDKPVIKYEEEYEMKRNDTEEAPEDVKIVAYQRKMKIGEDEIEGLFFKPILSNAYTTDLAEDDSYVVVAEKKNGEALEEPEIIAK